MRTTFAFAVLLALLPMAWAASSSAVSTENSRYIKAWSLTLIEVEHGPPDSDAIQMDVFLAAGPNKRQLIARDMVGPDLPLLKSGKLFFCESNDGMLTKGPVLFNLSGHMTTLPPHIGFLRECTTVGSGEEVMLQYNLLDESPAQKPYSVVRIFSSSGHLLLEKTMYTEGDVEYTVLGLTYRAHVPKPDYPG